MRRRLVLANLAALTVLAGVAWSQRPIPFETPATDAAIAEVRAEVGAGGYAAALIVNTYVAGHISRVAYEARTDTPPSWPIEAVVEDAFATGSGICGAATLTALALYDALGVEARPIEVWYRDPTGLRVGHITTEVRYDGAWHWFDPSWGTYFRDGDVLSVSEVVQMSPARQRATQVGDGPMAFVGYSPLWVVLDDRIVYSR